ncbi:hypothetical protein FBULB1_14340 [Fusarium bulbicola]|nr:hypothetical protein FBULB1_14340 [Fusarium bulbicola]
MAVSRDSDNELDSNDPSDLDYLEMKMDRRDRKRELRAQKEWEEEMRKKREKYREQMNEKTREEVATKDDIGPVIHYINEIREALDRAISLEETPTPLNLGLMRIFKLWSFDHIKHFPYEVAPKMSSKFSSKFDGAKFNEEQIRTIRAKKLSGYIHLLSDTAFDLGKFTPPEYCSTKTHNLGSNQEPARDHIFELGIDDIPWNAPSLFTYYGISERYMVDKEKQEEEEWETEEESVIE